MRLDSELRLGMMAFVIDCGPTEPQDVRGPFPIVGVSFRIPIRPGGPAPVESMEMRYAVQVGGAEARDFCPGNVFLTEGEAKARLALRHEGGGWGKGESASTTLE